MFDWPDIVAGDGADTFEARAEVFFFQAEDGIRDYKVTGVQTCALPIFAFQCSGYVLEDVHLHPAGPWSRRTVERQRPVRSRGARSVRRRLDGRGPRAGARSEERRVGKECRSRWSPYH